MQRAMTGHLQRTLARAHEEARTLQSRYVSTEHLLLGVLDDRECTGCRILGDMGLDTGRVGEALVAMVRQEEPVEATVVPMTGRARKALALAFEAAQSLGHDFVSTAHLLLGLMDEGEGLAWMLLDRLEVDRGRVQEATLALPAEG